MSENRLEIFARRTAFFRFMRIFYHRKMPPRDRSGELLLFLRENGPRKTLSGHERDDAAAVRRNRPRRLRDRDCSAVQRKSVELRAGFRSKDFEAFQRSLLGEELRKKRQRH